MRTDAPVRTPTPLVAEDPLPPPGPRYLAGWLVLCLVVGLVLGSGATALWYRAELRERDAATAAATTELTNRVGTLEAQLEDLRSEANTLREDLGAAQVRLDLMLGSGLEDGRRFGYIEAVGATQQPPRLVFDLARWFTGEAADAAAIEDGRMPPGLDHVENGYYIRNGTVRWQVVEVDPATMASLVVYPYGEIDAPELVTFERFGKLVLDEPWLRSFPYWLEVEDGIVTGIEQQFIP